MTAITNLKYSEILKKNSILGSRISENHYNISILSNIVTTQINEILEYDLRIENIPAQVRSGDYDNIVQDSLKHKDTNAIIIFWELCNIIEGLYYKIELFDEDQINKIFDKITSEIDLLLKNVHETSLVLINKFTSLPFSYANIRKNKFYNISVHLNQYLEKNIPSNVMLVDLEDVIANVGIERSIDLRYYYSSKALYTIDFFKAYTESIKPFMMSANGKMKKALIFDCDNTLWKGILGEDGFENIEMSPKTTDGAIFYEIQNLALSLNKKGILIGLCSKNNSADIDEVIRSHPDMLLSQKDIVVNKSNWLDKISNLKEISKELNIGLDSLVFVDDSSFEVNLVRDQLPEVTVLQVPERLYDYPKMIRENFDLFYNLSITKEDRKKIQMYKQQENRKSVKKEYSDIEDYLASLELKMTIHLDDNNIIPRISQMCQKTNQFNLTTKRYSESDIKNFIAKKDSKVIAFSISDKFGESGITGLSIINIIDEIKTADIDTLLMSCRIIGRNIEFAFMDHLINVLKKDKISIVKASYIKTKKNDQVKGFYNNCCFKCIDSNESYKKFSLDIKDYISKKINYIRIQNG